MRQVWGWLLTAWLCCALAAAGASGTVQTMGEGEKTARVAVKLYWGGERHYTVLYSGDNLLEGLLDAGLIGGEQTDDGFRVTEVDGMPARYGMEGTGDGWSWQLEMLMADGAYQPLNRPERETADAYDLRIVQSHPDFGEMKTIYAKVLLSDEDMREFTIRTARPDASLLEVLLEYGLISGEEAPWGFNVTTVDGVETHFEVDGSYWSMMLFNDETGEMEYLANGLGSIFVRDLPAESGYAFVLMR